MKQRFYIDTSVWGGLFIRQKKSQVMEVEIMVKEKEKEFDTVKTFREIKESISKDIWSLSYEDLLKYLEDAKRKTVQV
jgi:hypothetical protein